MPYELAYTIAKALESAVDNTQINPKRLRVMILKGLSEGEYKVRADIS